MVQAGGLTVVFICVLLDVLSGSLSVHLSAKESCVSVASDC